MRMGLREGMVGNHILIGDAKPPRMWLHIEGRKVFDPAGAEVVRLPYNIPL